jgi:hypothetical protein
MNQNYFENKKVYIVRRKPFGIVIKLGLTGPTLAPAT